MKRQYDMGLRGGNSTSIALTVLYREIGIVNTIRFLNQYTSGFGNYTEEREELLQGLSLDEILTEIKSRREQTGVKV